MVRKNSKRIVCDICGAVYWAVRRKACPECRTINKKIRSRCTVNGELIGPQVIKSVKIFRLVEKEMDI